MDSILDETPFYRESPEWRYWYCFYTAVSFLLGIEPFPNTLGEYIFCVCTILGGALLISYMLGEIADSITNMNKQLNRFFEDMDAATQTMNNFRLHDDLQERIAEHITNTHHYKLNQDDWKTFQEYIPPTFINRINEHLYRDIVTAEKIIGQFPEAVAYMVKSLDYDFFQAEQELTTIGDESTFFCMIISGSFEVYASLVDGQEEYVQTLHDGDTCGEIGLIYNVPRTATTRSLDYSKVGKLSVEQFQNMLDRSEGLEMAFKKKITKYKDVYRSKVLKALKTIPYIHAADPFTIEKILYTLKTETLERGTQLIEEGAISPYVFIIIEGQVDVKVDIIDLKVKEMMKKKVNVKKEKPVSFISRPKNSKPIIKSKATNVVSIVIDTLSEGSIICKILWNLGVPVPFTCVCKQNTTCLLLSTSQIETLFNTEKATREVMNTLRNKFFHYNSLHLDYLMIPPFLDYYKPVVGDRSTKYKTRLRKKMKNAILMQLLRNRINKAKGSVDFKGVVKKLQAIMDAEEHGWDIAKKLIEEGVMAPENVFSASMLESDELMMPLLNEFAGTAYKTSELFQGVENKYNELNELIKLLH